MFEDLKLKGVNLERRVVKRFGLFRYRENGVACPKR